MKITAAIANSLWLTSNLPALASFRRALNRPAECQRQRLHQYLVRNADSAFGRNHDFKEINSYEEFARRVPLHDYGDLIPWIERICSGESSVLTFESATHLVPTGGSTGARKLIPFTTSLQREFNRAVGSWISDIYGHYPSVALGSAYWSISPAVQMENLETSVVPVGFDDDSAYLGGARKRIVNAIMAVPSEIRMVSNIDQFRYLTLLCLLRERELRLISIWHPSFLSLLLDALPDFWNDLLRDIASGRCRYAECLSPIVLRSLKLRPLPDHASRLANADPLKPRTVWPSLKIISCWGDGHAEFARADLERRFPSVLIQSKGLLATECIVTIPFAGLYPLAITSHFFEFIDAQGEIYLAHELKENEVYEVVVTTGGGLWRYRLHDRVQVDGFVRNTPSLRFLGRAGNVSDHCGEKLSEQFVTKAMHAAMANLASRPQFAMLALDESYEGHCYTLYIEGDVTAQVRERLESVLCQNVHYAWCRRLGQLQAPRIFKIEKGGHETFILHRSSSGKRIGEIKPCALSSETGWTPRFCGAYLDAATNKLL